MELKEYKLMSRLEDNHWWFVSKRQYAKIVLNLISLSKKSTILDVGCGTGKNLAMLVNFGLVQGVDYSASAIKFCYQRGFKKVKQASLAKLPFKADTFDLVTLFDVLYHKGVASDAKALKEVSRVLKPSGYLLITDCAHQFLYGPHDISMHARQRYSKKELITKVNQAGFSIHKASYIYFITFPLFFINRFISKYLTKKSGSDVNQINPIINQLLIYLLFFESKLLKFFNLPIGSSIIILAKK